MHLWAFVIQITEANEANFAVFCHIFAQKFLTNQNLLKFPGNSRPGIETAPICIDEFSMALVLVTLVQSALTYLRGSKALNTVTFSCG